MLSRSRGKWFHLPLVASGLAGSGPCSVLCSLQTEEAPAAEKPEALRSNGDPTAADGRSTVE